ncbi:MAG: hypothetical protein ACLUKN_11465 [Bacilli bacterium]
MRLARGGLDGLCAPKAVANPGGAVFVPNAGTKIRDYRGSKRMKLRREDESNAEPNFSAIKYAIF